jgi:DNA-binding transcriptional ArsR family regulator
MPEELYTKKEYESLLIKTLGDSPKLRIIDFFLDNPMFDFTKKEVIEALGMSKQTLYKYFPDLEEYGVVEVSRKIGKAKLYKINLKHPLVSMLREYEKKISLQIAEKERAKLQEPMPTQPKEKLKT